MTAIVQPETKSPSRRAVLAGALGGIGALAATVIGRAAPVRATDGQPILQGADNTGTVGTLVRISTSSTALQGLVDATTGTTYGVRGRNSSTAGAGVYGVASASSGTSAGVRGVTDSPGGYGVWGGSDSLSGTIGVYGVSGSTIGVFGSSNSSDGVLGQSNSGRGVFGNSGATNAPAILGRSYGNSTGVEGYSGAGLQTTAKAKTGVFGYAIQDTTATGVRGESTIGVGVRGKATTGYAGFFDGRVFTTRYYELAEIATPNAPAANQARLFLRDSGGKTQLCVRFHTGAVKQLAIES